MEGKRMLELGSGSGMIACVAARRGADVIAVDINPLAVQVTKENATRNGLKLEAFESNLFESISDQTFDLIIINPPYYPKDPKDHTESAWFAGAEYQYFEGLFAQIGKFIRDDTKVFFSASDDVDIERIMEIAEKNSYELEVKLKKWTMWEWNYVYQLRISN